MLNAELRLNPKLFDDDVEQVAIRKGFGDGLVAAGKANPLVVVLCGDLTESAHALDPFKVELAFLLLVALATTMTVPVVGTTLIFSLMVGPPAAARALSTESCARSTCLSRTPRRTAAAMKARSTGREPAAVFSSVSSCCASPRPEPGLKTTKSGASGARRGGVMEG